MKKRIVSLLLAALLICTLLPTAAFAETSSGVCGADVSNLTWALDESGTLTVSGSGDMLDYSTVTVDDVVISTAPWADYAASIKSVVIKPGVTGIGEYAFYGCTGMTQLTLPDGVTRLGQLAFYGCTALSSVTVPGSVTEMGKCVFSKCTALKSAALHDGITTLGEWAFADCESLRSVSLPDSLLSIENSAFANCEALESIELPNKLNVIGDNAFFCCSGLKSIEIPDSVTTLGGCAFYGCSALGTVTVPGSVTSVGDSAFGACSGLKNVVIESGATHIGVRAFAECKELECIVIPSSVQSIGVRVFVDSDALRDILFGGTKDEWTAIGCTVKSSVRVHYGISSLEGHYSVVETVKAGCLTDGYVKYACACGYGYTEKLSATGHSFKDGMCENCGLKDPAAQENPFVDVAEDAVYCDAVLWAYYHEPEQITSGFDATHFGPQKACTRAQVVTFLWRAAGCPEPTGSIDVFKDASDIAAPFRKAVAWAVEKGITTGYEDSTFRPNDSVTRAQFVTFLWRYEGRPVSSGSIDGFKDAADIAAPYRDAVAWAVEKGVTTGYNDGSFRPNAICPRWAVVLFMYRDMK